VENLLGKYQGPTNCRRKGKAKCGQNLKIINTTERSKNGRNNKSTSTYSNTFNSILGVSGLVKNR